MSLGWPSILSTAYTSCAAHYDFLLLYVLYFKGPMYRAVLGDMLRTPPGVAAGLIAWVVIVGGTYMFAARLARTRGAAFLQVGFGIRGEILIYSG
jgi:hypothetical protein